MERDKGQAMRCAIPLAAILLTLLAASCGGGRAKQAAPTATTAATATRAGATTPANPKPLLGEAGSAAAGDIPDNQVFITYRGPLFSIKVPEGWPRSGSGRQITFRDKNNIVRVIARRGAPPTVQSVRQELGKRVTLVVDRYELGRRGRQAVVDLGTPAGVDNVDAGAGAETRG